MNMDLLRNKDTELFLQSGAVRGNVDKAVKENFKEKVVSFLNDLQDGTQDVEYEEDYSWVCETAVRWETYLKAEYDDMRVVDLPVPRRKLKSYSADVDILCSLSQNPSFNRIPVDLLSHYLMTYPSSGGAITMFAKIVLALVEGVTVLGTERRKSIKEITDLAYTLRPSCKNVADFVLKHLDSIDELRTSLREHVDTKSRLLEKLGRTFKSNAKQLKIEPGCGILTFGYSELFEPTLKCLEEDWKKTITIYSMPDCQYEGERIIKPRAAIFQDFGFQVEYLNDNSCSRLLDTKKTAVILLGCEIIGLGGNHLPEIINTRGSGDVAKVGKNNGATVSVLILAESYKIWHKKLYQKEIDKILNEFPVCDRDNVCRTISLGRRGLKAMAASKDRISSDSIDFFVTEYNNILTPDKFVEKYSAKLN